MQEETVPVIVHMSDHELWDLALFLKRAGYDDFRRLAVDELEAYAMRKACEALRAHLALAGYAPR